MRDLLVCLVQIPLQGSLTSSLRKGAIARPLGESVMFPLVWGTLCLSLENLAGCLSSRAEDEGVLGHSRDTWAGY